MISCCLLSISSCALAESVCEARNHSWLCAGEGQEHFHKGVARLRATARSAGTPVDKWVFYYTGNKAVTDMYKGIGTLQNSSFPGCYVPAARRFPDVARKLNFCSAWSGFTALKQCPADRIWNWSLAHLMAPGGSEQWNPWALLCLLQHFSIDWLFFLNFRQRWNHLCSSAGKQEGAGFCNAGVEETT